MVPKRPFHGEGMDGDGIPAQDAKRFKNAVKDVMGLLSLKDFVSNMEPFLRTVVRDEVEKTVWRFFQTSSSSSRHSFNQAETSGSRGFRLHFDRKIPSTIFTGGKVAAEDSSPIRIMLLDANGNLVTSGPLSSMKIELVVLDGDFGSDDQDEFNEIEFKANIIREREGRRPLVAGDLTVVLKNGVGQLGDIIFTDNSSWQRSRKFRLGARPVQKVSGVREARSDAFVVKDHRGELYKKHYPPSLKDEVWRLERIAKDGAIHTRLATNRIHSVKDFLQLYITDPSTLRDILGSGTSNRTWDTIIAHAITCSLDDGKFYTFYDAGQRVGVLFDSIYRVVAASFDGPNYEHVDSLSPPQKVLVETIKRQAYKNTSNLLLVDTNFVPRSLSSQQPEPFHSINDLSLQQLGFPTISHGLPEMQLEYPNSSSSTSYAFGGGESSSSQLGVSIAQTNHIMQVFPQALRQSFKFLDNFQTNYIGESSWSPPTSTAQWPLVTSSGQLNDDEGNAFLFTSSSEGLISSIPSFGVHMSRRIGKPKAGWCKLRAALKWGSVRREAAAKKSLMWPSFCIDNY